MLVAQENRRRSGLPLNSRIKNTHTHKKKQQNCRNFYKNKTNKEVERKKNESAKFTCTTTTKIEDTPTSHTHKFKMRKLQQVYMSTEREMDVFVLPCRMKNHTLSLHLSEADLPKTESVFPGGCGQCFEG